MSNTYKVRSVSVEVRIGDVLVPVTSVALHHTINTLPYAEVTLALDNQPSASGVASIGGVEINIKTLGQLAKVLQEKIYNTFDLTPDVSIVVDDDNVPVDAASTLERNSANKLEFRGFFANPQVIIRNGQLTLAFTALHYMIQLQAFNPQLYFATEFYGKDMDPLAGYLDNTAARNDSITSRTQVAIDGLMAAYVSNWMAVPNAATEKAAAQVEQSRPTLFEPAQWNMHILNQAVLDRVRQVMQDSETLTEIDGISLGGKPNPNFPETDLNSTIMSILANSPDMLAALSALSQPFVFQMNANWYDKVWLEHLQTMESPQSMISVPFDTINFNLASQFEVPLLQVVIRGPGSDFYAGAPMSTNASVAPIFPAIDNPSPSDFVALYDQSCRILGRYPGQIPLKSDGTPMPGRYMYVDSPSWVGHDASLLTPSIFVTKSENDDALNNWNQHMVDAQKRFAALAENRLSFLNYLAEYVFKDAFLQRTTARAQGPLFLRPQVGRTYFVRSSTQDNTIFMAFLNSVTHTIQVDSDGGSANTAYTFTHVRSRYGELTPVSLGNTTNGLSDAAVMGNLAVTEQTLENLQKQGMIYRQYTPVELAEAAARQRQQESDAIADLVPNPLAPDPLPIFKF